MTQVDKARAEAPWHWRWMTFMDALEHAWNWVLDRPYWCFEGNDPVLRTLRTGKRIH
ncbi:MAG: hypothetical protein V3T08_09860 [Gemmatimonadota bacterium]